MSGRLVILRHKSWHVWNQDNRERVLRDERLHREELEKKQKEEKEKIRESTFSLLNGDQATTTNSSSSNRNGDELDALLKDTEVVLGKRKQDCVSFLSSSAHPEFIKEKEQAEQRRKRREGIAEWELGKGSFESQSCKLWYNQLSKEGCNDDTIRGHNHALHDPMQKYMIYHDLGTIESKEDTAVEISQVQSLNDTESRSRKKSRHKHKKRKHKHDKQKHVDSGSDNEKEREKLTKAESIEALRQKRLEREKLERKKAATLLAQTDIYGGNYSVQKETNRYHQQYNPSIARNR